MKEHNNRKEAKKFTEFITGKELRQYVAKKVLEYVGENPTVFDGAVGSGQLEQFVNPTKIYAVEIQEKACNALKENFENVDVENKSFFNYTREDTLADCVIMNPPFSLTYKGLTLEEQANITKAFTWKKSGKLDDIFILKALKYTTRFAFFVVPLGITYRNTEEKFRQLIGNTLVELNVVKNAFEDTSIDVGFLVIDKEKTTSEVKKEIFDCKTNNCEFREEGDLEEEEKQYHKWMLPHVPIKEPEIDINKVNFDLKNNTIEGFRASLEVNKVLQKIGVETYSLDIIQEIRKICDEYELIFKEVE